VNKPAALVVAAAKAAWFCVLVIIGKASLKDLS
jgi:hypothetical protein